MNQRDNMLRRINDALPGLIMGILIYGILAEFIGVWCVSDKLRYTTGLAIGIVLACGMAINIAVVLRDAVDIYGESMARTKIIAKSVLRYIVVVVVFFVMMKWNIGNLFAAFIGVMGLKVSAYLQPFAHKCIFYWKSRCNACSDRSSNLASDLSQSDKIVEGRGDVSSNSEDSETI